jgi:hypothetical protein
MENDTAFQARRAAAVAAKHPDEVDAPTTEEVPNDTETGM